MKKFVCLATLLLSACGTSNINVKPISNVSTRPEADKSFYMALPQNGKEWPVFGFDMVEAEDSGKDVAEQMFSFMKQRGYVVTLGTVTETEKEALKSAAANHTDYMLYPKVNIWNDPMPETCRYYDNKQDVDEADIDVIIYDMKTKKVLNSYNISAHGCPYVFKLNGLLIPFGTMSPEGQFDKGLQEWIKYQECDGLAEDIAAQ